jgi:hypothetical protein
MKQEPELSRDIAKLSDTMKKVVEDILEEIRTYTITINGKEVVMSIFVNETIRTKERQKWLYEHRRSKTMKSKHLLGNACDIVVKENGYITYEIEKKPHVKDLYIKMGKTAQAIGKKHGVNITSGAIDWGWDYAHIEIS